MKFKSKVIFPHLLFLILILFSLRGVLFSPGIVGHTWDWGIPPFPEQFRIMFHSILHSWADHHALGSPGILYAMLLYEWLILTLLSFLGGAFLSKFMILLPLFLAGSFIFLLSRKLGMSQRISLLPALFYMFSPLAYSRIVAGHLGVVLGYALMPLFVLFLLKGFEDKKFLNSNIILAGIFFTLASTHPMLIGCNFIILSGLSFFEFLGRRERIRVVRVFIIILFIFCLLFASWVMPFLANILKGQVQLRGTLTLAEQAPMRMAVLEDRSFPLSNAFRLHISPMGLGTEYVFPPPQKLQALWTVASYFIPILIFGILLFALLRRIITRRERALFFLALLGVILVSGLKTPIGAFIYKVILLRLGPVFFEYSNPNRFSPIVAFSYALLLGLALQRIEPYLSQRRIRRWVFSLILIVVLIYISPFLSGNLSRPLSSGTQPLSLMVNRIHPEDRVVFDFLARDEEDFRQTFLPPAQISYVGKTDHIYEHTSFYFPKAMFLANFSEEPSFSQFVASTMFQPGCKSIYLGKLLGLANVKYILFPKYEEYYFYPSFGYLEEASQEETLYDPNGVLEKVLAQQEDIKESDRLSQLKSVILYENENYLPHLYPVNNVITTSGDFAALISLGYLPEFDLGKNTIVFASQLNEKENEVLKNRVSIYLLYNNDLINLLIPYLSREYVIYPGQHCTGFFKDWFTLKHWWDRDWHYGTSLKKSLGAQSYAQSKLPIEFTVASSPDTYDSYALVHFGPKDSSLRFLIDQREIGSIITKEETDSGFRWVRLNSISLDSGRHTLTLESGEGGRSAIMAIIIVPHKIIEEAFSELEKNMRKKEILLLMEAENIVPSPKAEKLVLDSYEEEKDVFRLHWSYESKNSLAQAYQKHNIILSPTENCLTPQGEDKGYLIYRVTFPYEVGRLRFISYPRIGHDREGKNYLRASYSLDGKNYETLYHLASDGSGQYSGIYETKKDNRLELRTRIIYLKFDFSPGSQLWADREHPMELRAEKYGSSQKVPQRRVSSASCGRAILLPLKGKVDIPLTGDYDLSIRAQAIEGGRIIFQIGSIKRESALIADPSYCWYHLGRVNLKKGVSRLFLSSTKKTHLDLVVFKRRSLEKRASTLPSSFQSDKINPTKYKIKVKTAEPFFLFFSESFNPKWQIHTPSGVINGIPGCGFGNLYYVAEIGNYTLNLEYSDQRHLRRGQMVTLSSWIILLGLLVTLKIRSKR